MHEYPSSVTREQFALILGILDGSTKSTKPRKYDIFDVFNAILYVVVGGIQWRMLPSDFPKWQSVYYYYSKWSKRGSDGRSAFEKAMAVLAAIFRANLEKRPYPSVGLLDSKSIRNAETANIKGYDAGKKVSGVKLHVMTDTLGLPIMLCVTPADSTDRNGALEMVGSSVKPENIKVVYVDRGYSGEQFAKQLEKLIPGVKVTVAKRSELHKFAVIPQRWIVERSFSWVDKCRRLWKNCEAQLNNTLQMAVLSFLRILLKRF